MNWIKKNGLPSVRLQTLGQVQPPVASQDDFERRAREVLQNQRQGAALINERERFGNTRDIQGLQQQVFAPQKSGAGRVGALRRELQQHWHPICHAAGAIEVRARCRADPFKGLTVRNEHNPLLCPDGCLARPSHVVFLLLNAAHARINVG
jgi:hypothetical protein